MENKITKLIQKTNRDMRDYEDSYYKILSSYMSLPAITFWITLPATIAPSRTTSGESGLLGFLLTEFP